MDAERFSVVDGVVLKDPSASTRLIQVGLDNDAHPRFVVDAGGNLYQGGGNQAPTAFIGAQGAQGPQGATGATGLTGPTGVTWRGTYSNSATYGLNDAVYNVTDGQSYVCVLGTTGNTPPNTTYWAQMGGVNTYDQDRSTASGVFEVYPASLINSGSGVTLTSGKQEYIFFRAMGSTAITKIRFSTQNASTTTTHAFVGIYAVDASWQPTTLLASSADTTAFITSSSFQSAYDSAGINNQFTLSASWTPTLYTYYALGLLWTGTGSPSVHGRTIDAGSAKAGYSSTYGTHFCSSSNSTGLTALVPTGTPAETAANLSTNARGVQISALFVP